MNLYAHIPTSEIEADIAITEVEIESMEREANHLAATPMSSNDAKWNHIRAQARRTGIKERKEFVAKLKGILEARQQQPTPAP